LNLFNVKFEQNSNYNIIISVFNKILKIYLENMELFLNLIVIMINRTKKHMFYNVLFNESFSMDKTSLLSEVCLIINKSVVLLQIKTRQSSNAPVPTRFTMI
jgi:hypothetical protein